MPVPTPSAPLPIGSDGAIRTVPEATDNARWLVIVITVGCIVRGEPIAEALGAASQLILVIIVLLLVRSRLPRAAAPYRGGRRCDD